jgi:enamine deaminase RidA (YjgF/YER057c/UK114 family)
MNPHVRFINPSTMAKPPGYTHVVEVSSGKMIFLSGQVAQDIDGNLVGDGDMAAQVRQIFENIQNALQAVGGDCTHIIKFTYFTTDFSELSSLRAIRDEYINTDHPPASTAVQVSRLFRPEFLIEIEAVAVLPD